MLRVGGGGAGGAAAPGLCRGPALGEAGPGERSSSPGRPTRRSGEWRGRWPSTRSRRWSGSGSRGEPIVRELFRNLVTAQWTRAVADREELLSVFPEPDAARRVLDQLIDARLLTSYEADASRPAGSRARVRTTRGRAASRTVHRIEIVHESLLKAWPRLVRWQAQDEEGAVLRDQLKQAAHLWEEKGRLRRPPVDGHVGAGVRAVAGPLPGEAHRARGGVRAGDGPTAPRAEAAPEGRHGRRRRRARVVAAAIAGSRQQAIEQARRAQAEALRAEAGKLLALGRTHLEDDPTAALAYARGSLELSDTPEARHVGSRGPVARARGPHPSLERMARSKGFRTTRAASVASPSAPTGAGSRRGAGAIDRSSSSHGTAARPGPCPAPPTGTPECSRSAPGATFSSREGRAKACASGRCRTCERPAAWSLGGSGPWAWYGAGD